MNINNKKPEAADLHIGRRVQECRKQVGMTQEQLGEHLGITFQQVQKYEKGANRISAGRLFSISRILETPVGFFYEGAEGWPTAGLNGSPGFHEGDEQPALVGAPKSDELTRLTRDFGRIADLEVRRTILALVHSLAAGSDAQPPARQRR